MGVIENEHGRFCTMVNPKSASTTFTVSVVLVFVLPMFAILVLYILIGLQLRRSKIVKRGGPAGSSVRLKVIN